MDASFLPNSSAEFFVNVLLVKTETVEHADEEAIFLLGVVLAFVGSVSDPQLMEWRPIARHLQRTEQLFEFVQVFQGDK